jgi:hypothetical protein
MDDRIYVLSELTIETINKERITTGCQSDQPCSTFPFFPVSMLHAPCTPPLANSISFCNIIMLLLLILRY